MSDRIIASNEALPDGVLIALTGEIDLHTSPELRSGMMQIAAKKPKRIVLDMSDVGYMDSSGVATLVEALQALRTYGGKLVLCGLQPKVKSIFQIAKLDTLFAIVDDCQTAKSQ